VTFERRRSDFERDARVTPFTGSCCSCCCCLHWIGAAIGGVVGMRLGWASAEKALGAPLPVEGKHGLTRGLSIGIFVAIGLFLGAVAFTFGDAFGKDGAVVYLVALALAPPVGILPVCLPLLLSAYGTRRRMLSVFLADLAKLPPKEGGGTSMSLYRAKLTPAPKTQALVEQFSVFCRHCWSDLGESMHLTTCPECNQPIDEPKISGPDYGVSIAWRASLASVGASTAGTLAGYLLMLVISLFIR
jgi:hypothetical protein